MAGRGLQAGVDRQGVIGIGLQARWQAEAAAGGGRHGMRDRGGRHGVAGMRYQAGGGGQVVEGLGWREGGGKQGMVGRGGRQGVAGKRQ